MNVRAKFECQSVVENDSGSSTTVVLHAVYGDGSDNAAWSTATPWGRLELAITNPAAVAAFTVGQAYYLDISPVPAAQPIAVDPAPVTDPAPAPTAAAPVDTTAAAATDTAATDTAAPVADPATPPAPASDPAPAATA